MGQHVRVYAPLTDEEALLRKEAAVQQGYRMAIRQSENILENLPPEAEVQHTAQKVTPVDDFDWDAWLKAPERVTEFQIIAKERNDI